MLHGKTKVNERTKRTRPIAVSKPLSRPTTSDSIPQAILVAILPLGSSNSSAPRQQTFATPFRDSSPIKS